MDVFLTDAEIAELDKQDPKKEKNGGFQGLMVARFTWFFLDTASFIIERLYHAH